ncbi:MAG: hypothetical protein HQL68_07155, partial [Magnetococcales bacterium]|nr:hypothetical protein [Magnetococcales bacterium]
KVIATDPPKPDSRVNFIKDQQSLLLATVLEKDLLLSLINLPADCIRSLSIPPTLEIADDPEILPV